MNSNASATPPPEERERPAGHTMYRRCVKTLSSALALLLALAACSGEKQDTTSSTPTETAASSTTAAPVADATTAQTAETGDEPVQGTWPGQIKMDAHAGIAWLHYVGAESGDFVPMRFRTDSDTGRKILAVCAADDLCEIEGTIRFLDEAPPENASAIGEIVRVDRVKKLPPDAM